MTSLRELRRAATAAIGCLGVREKDTVLVLCNPPQRRIAEALHEAASHRARIVDLLEYPTSTRHGEEPPPSVACALREASVVLSPTVYSISHTQTRIDATARGVRIAAMSSLSEAAFAQAVPVDYGQLERSSAHVAAALTAARTCHITSPIGTDVVLTIEGRTGISDCGQLSDAGAFGNLPAGEAYIAPIETFGDGVVAIDGSLAGYGLLRSPLRIELQGGRVVATEGEAGDWLIATLDAGGEGGRTIAEIGIGVNPGAHLTGISIVDEKALGTAHLAFGRNTSFGGANVAAVHIDGVLLSPTVKVDGRLLLEPRGT